MRNPSIHGISKFLFGCGIGTPQVRFSVVLYFFTLSKCYLNSDSLLSVDDYPVYDPKFFKMIQEEAHRRHEAMKADKECDKNLYIRYVTQK